MYDNINDQMVIHPKVINIAFSVFCETDLNSRCTAYASMIPNKMAMIKLPSMRYTNNV